MGAEFFGYDPLPRAEFQPAIELAAELKPGGSFVDVGCGVGTKLIRAQRVGLRASGLELNPRYAALARRLAPSANIEVGNAFDWTRYGEFDVVYCYRLCVADELQRQLDAHIIPLVRADAVLFWPCNPQPRDFGWELIAPHLWRHV